MRRADREQVEYIVHCYLSYRDKMDATERIAWEGPSIQEKIALFRGDRIQFSAFRPDVMAKKADLFLRYRITPEEIAGHALIKEVPDLQRCCLVMWIEYRNTYNEETKQRYSFRDCLNDLRRAYQVTLTEQEFKQHRSIAEKYVIERLRAMEHLAEMRKEAEGAA